MEIPQPVKDPISTNHTPDWVKYIVNKVLLDPEEPDSNNIECTDEGYVVYHRKVTKEDIETYHLLWHVEEVWVAQVMGTYE